MKPYARILIAALVGAFPLLSVDAATELTAEQALKSLQDGQARFLAGKPVYPHQDASRRAEIAAGQNPIATVLTCSDSRLPAELIFDQGLGDLFVVRVAGNVSDTDEVGTVEYGVGHLGTPLLVVMGHSNCGAVKAVLEGAQVHGSIPDLVDNIVPAVALARSAKPGAGPAALLAEAVKTNVWISIDDLFKRSSQVRDLVKAGKLKVVGAVYDLATGAVDVMGPHPEQGRLLAYTDGAATHTGGSPVAEHADAAHAVAASGGAAPASGAAQTAPAPAVEYRSAFAAWVSGAALVLALVLGGFWRFSNRGMEHWTVGRRIATGFTAVLVVLSAVAYFGYAGLHHAFEDFTEYRDDARHSVLAGRIQANFLEARIAVKDYRITGNADDVAQFAQRHAKTVGFIAAAKTTVRQPERVKMLALIEEQLAAFAVCFADMQKATAARRTRDLADIVRRMVPLGETIDHELEKLKLEFIADQDRAGPRVNFQLQEAQRTILVVCVGALVLGAGLSWIIARSITRPLQRITGGLSDGSEQVSSAANQVSSSAQALAEGASESAAALEETSASLEEVTSMTKRNADNAAQAKELSAQTRAAADVGATDMQQMKVAMDAIKLSSGEIAKIVKTIDEIAFQTNILALNAAVEAARAGEAGMGFAVVAEEVRALAQRSALAARETAAKIEDSVSKSEHGVHFSAKVAASLQQIVERARMVDTLVAEIATASDEQSRGISQVNTAVAEMDQVTQSNAGSAEESAAAAEELNAQSAELRRIVGDLGSLVGISGTAGASSSREVARNEGSKQTRSPSQHAKLNAKRGAVPTRGGATSVPARVSEPSRSPEAADCFR